MPYVPYYADWHDKPTLDTPFTAAVGEHIEAGIVAAQALAEATAAVVPGLAAVTGARQTLPAANTYIVGRSIPAGLLVVGSRFLIILDFSNPTTASTTTITIKYGTAGTTADTTIHTATFTGTNVADVARVVIDVQVDVINATTGAITVVSSMTRNLGTGATGFHNAAGNPTAVTQTSTLNTTAARTLGVAVQETAATTVLLNAVIEHIK